MTVDAVTEVIEKIKGDKSRVMTYGLGIPQPLVKEIEQRRCFSDREKSRLFADIYVNFHPNASWEVLTRRLYSWEQLAAVRESRSRMSTGKCYQ